MKESKLPKLLNNLSSLKDRKCLSCLNMQKFVPFAFFSFSLVLVLIEKIYQTLETVFHHISKHLKVHQKYLAVRRIFNSLVFSP